MPTKTSKYEDNFGFYEVDGDPDEQAFLDHVKASSSLKRCKRCKRPVKLMPKRTLCASCVEAIECGGEP